LQKQHSNVHSEPQNCSASVYTFKFYRIPTVKIIKAYYSIFTVEGKRLPPKGWTTITVREEVKKEFEEFMRRENLTSTSDALKLLLDRYRTYKLIEKTLEELKRLCSSASP